MLKDQLSTIEQRFSSQPVQHTPTGFSKKLTTLDLAIAQHHSGMEM